ncbi:serine protease 53-like [Notolabrus celidotus]|uniref:serine protease 53-like n=1 Tax=Notolabrus celidotus TaxID=1203425 RepID=UPI0014905670|nr:serine protease 53-like [Notolabrus celidotus]
MQALQKCPFFYLLTCLALHALGSEIINGKKVPEKMMQYMASLQNDAGNHVCGGFLIREDFVLTAAHCLNGTTSVVLGTHNLKKVDNNTMRFRVKPCKHPSYNNEGSGNDIMLLKLSKKAKQSKKVTRIQLPTSDIKIKDNTKCRVAGWGFTKTGGKIVNVLQEVDVNVINLEICKRKWKTDKFELPANVICAGGYKTDKGFCKFDSGGPLVCDGKALGIVSFNKWENCNYPDLPNVYTDISKYLPWIEKILKQKRLTMDPIYVLLLVVVLNVADGTRIVGGRDAEPHSRPYMASLQVRGQHFCGGALVKEDFVLTAAHCLLNVPLTVVLGVDSLSTNESTKQEFRVLRSIPHPNYDGHENDIMLLKLSGNASLTNAVQLIAPKRGRLGQCDTAGWGDIGDNNTLASRLQEVNVTLLSLRRCQRRWGAVPIVRSMVCGIGAQVLQGFCSGDSGGPLVCDGAAAGVVSFSGRRCGDPNTPDVYTRVSSFRGWIRNVLLNN